MAADAAQTIEKKPINFANILLGAGLNLAEVTTLGQPLEVVKTTMAANRSLSLVQAGKLVWSRGGVLGFYQGLIPWAWIEASTKGAVLLFVSAEAEYQYRSLGFSSFLAGMGGGVTGGVAQAYLTMGFCTCMKTVEITRAKQAAVAGAPQLTSFQVFKEIYRKEGIRGINKGVNAVAIRQMTNWGSRFGLSRLAEDGIKNLTGKGKDDRLNAVEKIAASCVGGGLSAWNQPIEVIRVEMQSKTADPNRPKNLGVFSAAKYIYSNNGVKGLYRGVAPRVGLGVWQTVFMVAFGDIFKKLLKTDGGH
ncbi:mitochondrial carrier [Metschnikowia bicuspidata var. bicuspidata NRRL YB-4993]|uniref:Mitochondrial carrier n=1 Tax=Metschnikowia bicuspidata var. bicuspidata NRRL YB-4993 TaxID=869754 RepID=A0A1A0HIH5_9ASCO|nr:mitochondrial carrier [Metschnikowia bicuspidata var. bicuspidata NRRL YB-4993]OBA23801.1 mitochondrial carrier [Metschnikowia bicuspidata var. bicuspidata NRRL YB-4993]